MGGGGGDGLRLIPLGHCGDIALMISEAVGEGAGIVASEPWEDSECGEPGGEGVGDLVSRTCESVGERGGDGDGDGVGDGDGDFASRTWESVGESGGLDGFASCCEDAMLSVL